MPMLGRPLQVVWIDFGRSMTREEYQEEQEEEEEEYQENFEGACEAELAVLDALFGRRAPSADEPAAGEHE